MSFKEEIQAHRYRTLKTFALYFLFITAGLGCALNGPALLDLQIATRTTIDEITYTIPAGSSGYIIGATICGVLIEMVDSQIIIILSLIGNALTSAYIPWCRTLIEICITQATTGAMFGVLNTACNVWLIHLWGKESAPFMQALHFAYGIGSLFGPLLAEPFLLPVKSNSEVQVSSNGTNVTVTPLNDFGGYTPADLKVQYAYSIASGLMLLAACVLFVVYMFKRDNKPHPSRSEEDKSELSSGTSGKKIIVVLLTCIFMFLYFGLELGFGNLLTTYAVKCDLKLNKSTGSFMTAIFWFTFTFFRCFTIFIVDFLGSQNLIILDLTLVSAANAILIPYGSKYEWALWTGVSLMGLGLSSLFAAVLGYLEDFMVVTSKITSLMLISSSCGAFIVPYIVGNYIDSFADIVLYIGFFCASSMCIIFSCIVLMKSRFQTKLQSKEVVLTKF